MALPGVRMHQSNNGHATVFFLPRSCTFTSVTSVSCRLLLWSSYSVQSLVVPTGRRVLLVTKSATVLGSWTSSQPLKEFAQQVESSAGFVFSEDLQHFLGVLRRLPDHIRHSFQGRYLAQLTTFSNDRLVARAQPIRFHGSCSADQISDTSAAISAVVHNGSAV